jgi:hypothetical protein
MSNLAETSTHIQRRKKKKEPCHMDQSFIAIQHPDYRRGSLKVMLSRRK